MRSFPPSPLYLQKASDGSGEWAIENVQNGECELLPSIVSGENRKEGTQVGVENPEVYTACAVEKGSPEHRVYFQSKNLFGLWPDQDGHTHVPHTSLEKAANARAKERGDDDYEELEEDGDVILKVMTPEDAVSWLEEEGLSIVLLNTISIESESMFFPKEAPVAVLPSGIVLDTGGDLYSDCKLFHPFFSN